MGEGGQRMVRGSLRIRGDFDVSAYQCYNDSGIGSRKEYAGLVYCRCPVQLFEYPWEHTAADAFFV